MSVCVSCVQCGLTVFPHRWMSMWENPCWCGLRPPPTRTPLTPCSTVGELTSSQTRTAGGGGRLVGGGQAGDGSSVRGAHSNRDKRDQYSVKAFNVFISVNKVI